jgi:hypothetical protein
VITGEALVKSSLVRVIARGLCGIIAFLAGLYAGSMVVVAQQPAPSIRQQLEETGGFDRIIVSSDEALPLAQLTARAKLVVEVSVAYSQSYIDESGADVYTDYTINVANVIKNRERSVVQNGDLLTVRRRNGAVVINGHSAEVYENGFPGFQPGERYVLFLTRGPRDYVYSVLGGNQGAFTSGDTIAPVATSVDGPILTRSTRTEFLGEVQALLKFSEY